MRSRPAVLAALLPVLLLPVACGGDDGSITAASTTTGAGGGGAALSAEACAAFAADDPPADLAGLVPERYREAAGAVVSMFQAMEDVDLSDDPGSGAGEPSPAAVELADALAEPGVGEDLVALAEQVEADCDDESVEAARALKLLGGTSAIVAAEADDAYCAAVAGVLTDPESGSSPTDAAMAELSDLAPPEHEELVDLLTRVAAEEDAPTGEEGEQTAIALVGLGLYAEARCGQPAAFAQMMLGAAFLMMGDALGGDEGSGDGDGVGGETGTEPPTADAAAATAAAPSGTAFEVIRADLEEDGEYLASVVVPSGWDQDNSFNVTFEPPEDAGLGFFTELVVGAGCDGMCSPTDWEARLRGPEGYLTLTLDGWSVTEDRAPAGSEGAVITATDEDGEVLVLVLRWDDDADRYFECRARLEAEDAALGPALLAACEASRPGWIPVS